ASCSPAHCCCLVIFRLSAAAPPPSPLFPYTTLFRSGGCLPSRPLGGPGGGPRRPPEPGPSPARCHPGPDRPQPAAGPPLAGRAGDRKSTRLNSSHVKISYAVFCLKKKTTEENLLLLR